MSEPESCSCVRSWQRRLFEDKSENFITDGWVFSFCLGSINSFVNHDLLAWCLWRRRRRHRQLRNTSCRALKLSKRLTVMLLSSCQSPVLRFFHSLSKLEQWHEHGLTYIETGNMKKKKLNPVHAKCLAGGQRDLSWEIFEVPHVWLRLYLWAEDHLQFMTWWKLISHSIGYSNFTQTTRFSHKVRKSQTVFLCLSLHLWSCRCRLVCLYSDSYLNINIKTFHSIIHFTFYLKFLT